jgi:four helix bundle protein
MGGESRIQNPESRTKRNPARDFTELIVWQKAHGFVLKVYGVSRKFPPDEKFGLTTQFRRAAVSVAANIAEGFKKKGRLDKVRFLNISQGSLEECRYYLFLAGDLGYCETPSLMNELGEVSRLLERYSATILDSGF